VARGPYDGRMPLLLVVALVAVPLVELAVLIQVGQWLGAGWAILLVVATGVIGGVLLRHEGRRAWMRFQRALAEGRWPGDEVAQGALIILGGALLLTPGFITDVVGFLLLAPPSRAVVAAVLRSRLVVGGRRDRGRADAARPSARGGSELDIEVVEIRRDEPPHEGPSEQGPPRDDDEGREG